MSTSTASIRSVARHVKSWMGSRVVILLYHRIARPEAVSVCDPHRIAVTPEDFESQMEIVTRAGRVMRLAELADALENRRLPKRGIVVTFDDGYADNLYTARPILEKFDVPATVFMTAGDIGRAREFWWDELAQLLLESGELPQSLHLRVGDRDIEWTFDGCTAWSAADSQQYSDWDFESDNQPTARHRAYREIYRLLWDLQDAPRRAMLDDLFSQATRTPRVRQTHRALNDAEIIALNAGNQIEIGAHTMTHPNLAAQTLQIQADEIKTSKGRLEAVLGHSVDSFAYPFGLHTPETVKIVQEAGFLRACACMGHAVRQSSEMFRLTRADIGGSSGDVFEKKLKEAFIR